MGWEMLYPFEYLTALKARGRKKCNVTIIFRLSRHTMGRCLEASLLQQRRSVGLHPAGGREEKVVEWQRSPE